MTYSLNERDREIPVQIGDHRVGGANQPALIIAEAGVNHNGDLSMAHRLIEAAAAAGSDAIKFQTFSAEAIVTSTAATAPYQEAAGQGGNQRAMLHALELPRHAWKDLQSHATDAGLLFLSTAFDESSLGLLIDLGVQALKVPSGELTNVTFLDAHARSGLPVLASTGMASMREVDLAVEILATGTAGLALFHCVTAYPTPVEASNLRAITSMRARHNVPVGWSDHTVGSLTAITARALGAALIEKHLTLDKGLPGPDHRASASPAELTAYVDDIRQCELALGTGLKEPTAIEIENRNTARRSYYAVRDIARGAKLSELDVTILRPVSGIPASERILGRTAARDIPAGSSIDWRDLE